MLGLIPWEHEWKIMGLAPYSPERGKKRSYEVFKKYLKIADKTLTFERSIPEPTYLIYPRLRRELEFYRFDWISGGLQMFTEELLCRWIRNAIKKTGIHKIALSGGVFMNVKANKRIMEMGEVADMFIFPSCGDESNPIGAAYYVYTKKPTGNYDRDLKNRIGIYFTGDKGKKGYMYVSEDTFKKYYKQQK